MPLDGGGAELSAGAAGAGAPVVSVTLDEGVPVVVVLSVVDVVSDTQLHRFWL